MNMQSFDDVERRAHDSDLATYRTWNKLYIGHHIESTLFEVGWVTTPDSGGKATLQFLEPDAVYDSIKKFFPEMIN